MYGIFVECADGYVEMPLTANSRQEAERKRRQVATDPNWEGAVKVWFEELDESPTEES